MHQHTSTQAKQEGCNNIEADRRLRTSVGASFLAGVWEEEEEDWPEEGLEGEEEEDEEDMDFLLDEGFPRT